MNQHRQDNPEVSPLSTSSLNLFSSIFILVMEEHQQQLAVAVINQIKILKLPPAT